MARGWESKGVESQQEVGPGADRGEDLTPEQREVRRKRESLELDRRRVLHDLQAAQSPMRRAYLERALAFLNEEIAKLGEES
jgi:hypothetical protein